MSMHGRRVLDYIDDVCVLRQRHPVVFARVSRCGGDGEILALASQALESGGTTRFFHAPERLTSRQRQARRAKCKAQRLARKANR